MNALVNPPRNAIQLPANRRGMPVFAMAGETDIAALARLFEGNNATVQAALSRADEKIGSLVAEIDKLNANSAAFKVMGGGSQKKAQRQKENAALGLFARTGDLTGIKALNSVGSDPDGGYLVIPELEKSIRKIARDVSPMRALCNVQTIGSGSYKIVVDASLSQASFVGEQQQRTETQGPQLVEIEIPANELYAMPKATQTLIDDAFVDLGAWLSGSVSTAFALKEGQKFVSGQGTLEPTGFLTYGAEAGDDFTRSKYNVLQYYPVGASAPTDVQLADGLVALATKIRVPYRSNSTWLIPRAMALRIRQIKDGVGRYLWSQDTLLNGQIQEALLGFPIAYCEDMPAQAANAFPIALGDWKQGYTIVDRIGIRTLRDPFSAKPYILFYVTKRVGGGMVDFNAIKLLKYSAS
jgi:HK97 family phage major capsid protein